MTFDYNGLHYTYTETNATLSDYGTDLTAEDFPLLPI